jgi:hypothetical protein
MGMAAALSETCRSEVVRNGEVEWMWERGDRGMNGRSDAIADSCHRRIVPDGLCEGFRMRMVFVVMREIFSACGEESQREKPSAKCQ